MHKALEAYWFIDAAFNTYLITAPNREAANGKFNTMHPGVKYLLTMPAIQCSHCHKFRKPIDRDAHKLNYKDATTCDTAAHQSTVQVHHDLLTQQHLS